MAHGAPGSFACVLPSHSDIAQPIFNFCLLWSLYQVNLRRCCLWPQKSASSELPAYGVDRGIRYRPMNFRWFKTGLTVPLSNMGEEFKGTVLLLVLL